MERWRGRNILCSFVGEASGGESRLDEPCLAEKPAHLTQGHTVAGKQYDASHGIITAHLRYDRAKSEDTTDCLQKRVGSHEAKPKSKASRFSNRDSCNDTRECFLGLFRSGCA